MIGLALQLEGNLPFLLCFTLYLRAISKYKLPGDLYLDGRFNGGFFALPVWGAYIWRGLFSEFYRIFLKMVSIKCRLQTAADHCFHHANENVTKIVPLLSNPENN